jgi:CubicO group peptidase (beta-lactamase class C family)
MASTALLAEGDLAQRLAPPYRADTTEDRSWTFDAMAGAGAIRSTVSDMLRYAAAHLDPPEGPLGAALRLATDLHHDGKPGESDMGLGWHASGAKRRWHNGQTGGYHSFLALDLEAHRAVVVLSNTATGHVDRIGDEVFRTLAGQEVAPAVLDPVRAVAPEVLARYEGTYELQPGVLFVVRPDGDRLFVRLADQPEFRVFPDGADAAAHAYRYRVVEAKLVFEVPDEGLATAVVLHQNGRVMRAARRP